jgi:photosystem II stability/assembly factor-like uncharacterized protein
MFCGNYKPTTLAMKTNTLCIAFTCIIVMCSLNSFTQKISKLSDFPNEIKESNPFKRMEWFYNQRLNPNQKLNYQYAHEVFAKELDRIQADFYNTKGQLNWIPKGPAGFMWAGDGSNFKATSGRVRALAIHPSDPLIVYIGAASGGLWKTTDGGDTWQDVGKDLKSLTFGAIAIDPNNPDVVYAGSGEACSLTSSIWFGGSGLYKSSDAGETWSQITDGFGEQTHFSDIIVNPSNSNIVFATLANGSYNLGDNLSNEGIWKSEDAGLTWERKSELTDAFDIAYHPTDQNLVYATIGGSTEQSGFYISNDLGETWTQSNSGLQDASTISRIQFDVSKSDPNIIYAVIYEFPGMQHPWTGTTRAYKTLNGGLSWTQISEGVNLSGLDNDQGFYNLSIVVDPTDTDHVLLGSMLLFETFNGKDFSQKWASFASADVVPHNDFHRMVFSPSNPEYLYLGCDGGVYQSSDTCKTFTSKNDGLETLQFYRIASHPTDPDIIVGGMQDNGIIMTFDGGENWRHKRPGDGTECFFDYSNPQNVYASRIGGELFKSTNGGAIFNTLKKLNGAWVTPFSIHPSSSDTIYAANRNLYQGVGYNMVPLTENLSPEFITSLAQSKINPQNMILCSGGSIENDDVPFGGAVPDSLYLVMVSKDGGFNWTDVTANIPGETRWISKVVTDPVDENTMYVVRCGFCPANKIYKTEDLGETWMNISGNLPDIPCNDLFIDPQIPGNLYVATDIGVYLSQNGGETYVYAGNNMPTVPIMDFDYVNIDNKRCLRVATFGRSIYETTDLDDLTINIDNEKINKEIKIEVIPNPFFDNTTISYELEESGYTQIEIFSLTGQRITILLSENQDAGRHEIEWDASELTRGIYICKLNTKNSYNTFKIILLR